MAVQGYKAFRVLEAPLRLTGIYYNAVWDTRVLRACCYEHTRPTYEYTRLTGVVSLVETVFRQRHVAPMVNCHDHMGGRKAGHGCGIYVALTCEQARLWARKVSPPTVVGMVEAWGRSVPHTDGYRIQWCKLTGIVGEGDLEERVAGRYGVPLLPEEVE